MGRSSAAARKFWAARKAERSRLHQGPLTPDEQRLITLLCQGDDERFVAASAAFAKATEVERLPGFLMRVSAPPSKLRWMRGGRFWSPDDLVILDERVGVLNVSLYGGGIPVVLTAEFRLHDRETPPEEWPPSLRADSWGYLGPGEPFDGSVPASRSRVRSDFDPEPASPGTAPKWLRELLDSATDVEGTGPFPAELLPDDLPREVAQFYRWSDGCRWGELTIQPFGELIELDHLPGFLIFDTDVAGNGLAFDLTRKTATSCPVVAIDHASGTILDDEAMTVRVFLAKTVQ